VRPATEADAAAICRIYNQGIEDRVATLETELRTPDERRQWLAAKSPRHPVIVAEAESGITEPRTISNRPATVRAGQAPLATTQPGTTSNSAPTERAGHAAVAPIIAWGSLNQFNPREAYKHVVDFSIYVDRAHRGKGVGNVVLTRLVELAREHGYHKMVLSAFPSNTGGLALYEKLGFRTVGIYKEQGMLDGRWVDTIIMEKLL
jgi:phosphinothricin acetyltransferase